MTAVVIIVAILIANVIIVDIFTWPITSIMVFDVLVNGVRVMMLLDLQWHMNGYTSVMRSTSSDIANCQVHDDRHRHLRNIIKWMIECE